MGWSFFALRIHTSCAPWWRRHVRAMPNLSVSAQTQSPRAKRVADAIAPAAGLRHSAHLPSCRLPLCARRPALLAAAACENHCCLLSSWKGGRSGAPPWATAGRGRMDEGTGGSRPLHSARASAGSVGNPSGLPARGPLQSEAAGGGGGWARSTRECPLRILRVGASAAGLDARGRQRARASAHLPRYWGVLQTQCPAWNRWSLAKLPKAEHGTSARCAGSHSVNIVCLGMSCQHPDPSRFLTTFA